MEGRRRTIELDEEVADALEKRAAERGVSLDAHLAEFASENASVVVLPPDELAELDARWAEWERDRIGYDAEEMFDWLRDRVERRDTPHPQPRRF